MKKMKKIVALLLAAVMVLGMNLNVFATGDSGNVTGISTEGTNNDSGKITITNPEAGQTYKAYQILVLESYSFDTDAAKGNFVYKPVAAWQSFIENASELSVTDDGYVKWTGGSEGSAVAAFAQRALTYAQENSISATETLEATDADPIVFEGLNLGYYLIDSSLGALCALNTTHPEVQITEKNTPPVLDKKVKNPAGNYVEAISKKVGDKVEFATKLVVYPGSENLIYHDQMEESLTFNMTGSADYVADTVEVYKTPMANGVKLTLGEDYNVVVNGTTDHAKHAECVDENCISAETECEFEVVFTPDYLATITERTEVTIAYTATLNEKANVIQSGTGSESDANVNNAKITYGDKSCSAWDPAKVYSYRFELVKTDVNEIVLDGAEFKLYDAATGGNEIPLVKQSDNKTYKVDMSLTTGDTIVAGDVMIEGLALGTYYLEETKAPEGYTKLTGREPVTIDETHGSNVATILDNVYQSGGVKIENLSGDMMPATGGIGTTIFYVAGGALVLAAIVVMITRKRMSAEE